jgi:hypothetical protein
MVMGKFFSPSLSPHEEIIPAGIPIPAIIQQPKPIYVYNIRLCNTNQ